MSLTASTWGSGMEKQSVLIGEIVLENEPRIALYAQTPIPLSNTGVVVLKDKLAFLLDSRFHASDPSRPYMSIAEIQEKWNCPPAKIAHLVRCDRLHPLVMNDEAYFDPAEVARVLSFR